MEAEEIMPSFKIGCQTYSWEMLGAEWRGTPERILDAIAAAGYAGVEFSNNMIGKFFEHPGQFEKELEKRGLACAAFAYARDGFTDPRQFEEDLVGVEKALRFTAHFGVPLCLGGPSSPSRENAGEKITQALSFYQEVSRRAEGRGVLLAIHPHSHHTSLVITAEEYEHLLGAVEPLGIGFNPDTGHILRGGQNLMACLRRYRSRIQHVHIKDVDASGVWTPLGKGVTPLGEVLGWLEETGYTGWVVIEEESGAVRPDPAQAIAANRRTLQAMRY
jgi:sugar phosphate isomerase/epimerase